VDHDPSLTQTEISNVQVLTDPGALEHGWLLGFSSRRGGVSPAPFDTLNLALRGGDRPELVTENRRRVASAVGIPVDSLALARQVHRADVLRAEPGQSGVLGEADVLVATEPGPVLGIFTADCAPVLLAGRRGVAVAHAGWRGLVAGAIERAVEAVSPVTAAWIGPCIHACCYEVGPEVIAAFQDAGLPISGPDRIDPAEASAFALRRAGAPKVAVASACTCCDTDYFSYRRDGLTGRQGAFLALVGP
jgi:YfiH family protein